MHGDTGHRTQRGLIPRRIPEYHPGPPPGTVHTVVSVAFEDPGVSPPGSGPPPALQPPAPIGEAKSTVHSEAGAPKGHPRPTGHCTHRDLDAQDTPGTVHSMVW